MWNKPILLISIYKYQYCGQIFCMLLKCKRKKAAIQLQILKNLQLYIFIFSLLKNRSQCYLFAILYLFISFGHHHTPAHIILKAEQITKRAFLLLFYYYLFEIYINRKKENMIAIGNVQFHLNRSIYLISLKIMNQKSSF